MKKTHCVNHHEKTPENVDKWYTCKACKRKKDRKYQKTHPEYRAYHNAEQRCNNPNSQRYNSYGGRGIEFRFSSFQEFYKEVGPRPPGTTLERHNTNGHYEAGNCSWEPDSVQRANRRSSPFYKAVALVEQSFIELLKAA